jgi:hypothetical protein
MRHDSQAEAPMKFSRGHKRMENHSGNRITQETLANAASEKLSKYVFGTPKIANAS